MLLLLQLFNPRGNVERPDVPERQSALFAPREKLAAGTRIGPPRVVVIDVGGEELDVAPARLVAAGVGDQGWHYIGTRLSGGWRRGKRLEIAGSWSSGGGIGPSLYHKCC
jgi:hypothetical protein